MVLFNNMETSLKYCPIMEGILIIYKSITNFSKRLLELLSFSPTTVCRILVSDTIFTRSNIPEKILRLVDYKTLEQVK